MEADDHKRGAISFCFCDIIFGNINEIFLLINDIISNQGYLSGGVVDIFNLGLD
ncbi:hypothetical protein SDC9_156636 [bioreactor metagenome]|uniref:Uncharacterized protein n=1 Tax=bioreactor metagenome TaxID=1076179 RepID=A0A645F579_9ZZZZ